MLSATIYPFMRVSSRCTEKILLFLLAFSFFTVSNYSQNITNTIASNGYFYVKDGTTTFLTLRQSNGYLGIGTTPNQQLEITKNFRLPNTTGSDVGVIYKEGVRFMHNYGTDNTFLGAYSGNFSLTSQKNTGVGKSSLYSISSGGYNTAIGYSALYANNTGSNNTAVGTYSLNGNTDGGGNTAIGRNSLGSNTEGDLNTAIGNSSLYTNTTGIWNTAVGYESLYSNQLGNYNTAAGYRSLYLSTGSLNVGFGNYAGNDITTGSNNICIGYNAQVPTATASNQVRIGNTDITYAGVQVAWTVTSDKRWKDKICSSNLGLDFISKLNPVSYIRKNNDTHRTEYGFIAQEVEKVLQQQGENSSGMITIDDKGFYSMRYNDLFAPIVKAIQELRQQNDKLAAENTELKNKMALLINMGNDLKEVKQLKEEFNWLINFIQASNKENKNQPPVGEISSGTACPPDKSGSEKYALNN